EGGQQSASKHGTPVENGTTKFVKTRRITPSFECDCQLASCMVDRSNGRAVRSFAGLIWDDVGGKVPGSAAAALTMTGSGEH
ncbi:MAG: hypothetical protein J0G37_15650, partial [Afipia sp.]|nr:hypothetical protein [Afipia sp.]